ncbi:hypothetical protein IX51_00625 [uncultured archaeon]|nr:hypothetical protein IX51_00625 [uncultured archaeon]
MIIVFCIRLPRGDHGVFKKAFEFLKNDKLAVGSLYLDLQLISKCLFWVFRHFLIYKNFSRRKASF